MLQQQFPSDLIAITFCENKTVLKNVHCKEKKYAVKDAFYFQKTLPIVIDVNL